ncbi:MAG: lipoprotein [Gammaproteobacteria bacterium]|nr:lipoprotein [Gammaproteobacteria bacterium]
MTAFSERFSQKSIHGRLPLASANAAPQPAGRIALIRRVLSLGLLLAVMAGCGQKGDLYRPDKQQKFAAFPERSARG